ncbi:MAG: HyaD/HybD family hydrogenase maturation endopeptidase [Thermodesulfovibrionales bacterium]
MRTALIGLGNILLSDEGIGVHAINLIRQRYAFEPEIDIIDGGTLGLDLLHFFENRNDVVIVDAVNLKQAPGYIKILRNEEIPSTINKKLTVHHIGLADILSSLRLLGKYPKNIVLVGIQPKSLEMTLDMTDVLKDRLEDIIQFTIKELEVIGHKCALQYHQR